MVPGHRPDVQDGVAGVSMEAGTAMEPRVWLKAPVLAAWIYIYIHIPYISPTETNNFKIAAKLQPRLAAC